jgi:cyclomaltodextrinase
MLQPYKKQDGDAFIKRYFRGSLTDRAAFPYLSSGNEIRMDFYIKNTFQPYNAFFYLGNDKEVIISRQILCVGEENGYKIFSAEVNIPEITGEEKRGLFFYHFEAETPEGRVYTRTDGVNCTLEKAFYNEWQLSIYSEEYDAPSWLDGGVMYHIFVDRFAKGSYSFTRSDSVYNYDWENGVPEYPEKPGDEFPNNTHFGGNLYGAAEKLDYLSELGVTCVYLSPVFKAYSNHKYDTGDFMQVDENFGGNEALELFIKKAAERGIAVILDGVFNHVGADSIYFNKYGKYPSVGAYQSRASQYYDWFSFDEYPDRYDSWWGVKNLPKVRKSDSFLSFICDTVIPEYMRLGLSGWRLDVVDELPGAFAERITSSVKQYKNDAYIVGEVWEDASNKIAYNERKRYFLGKQLDGVMNYPIRDAVIEFILYKDSTRLKRTLQTLYEHYPPHKLRHIMNIVGTHDTERILSVLSGKSCAHMTNAELSCLRLTEEERRTAVKRLKNAYLLLAFLPGVLCIYYGDEAGLEGWRDPFNRRPFPWHNIDADLQEWYKEVNKLRLNDPLFKADELTIFETQPSCFVCERYNGNNESSLNMFVNFSDEDLRFEIYHKTVDNNHELKYNNDTTTLEVPAESIRIFRKVDNTWTLLI